MAVSGCMSPTSHRPSSQARHASCTHQHMTRLYDEFGCDQCSVCRKRPPLGWLYRCTQDTGGYLPASDFFNVENTPARPEQDARMYTLSPSISKAIGQNLYADDQVLQLVLQKENVKQVILATRPTTASSTSTTASFDSTPEGTTVSTALSSATDSVPDVTLDTAAGKPLTPIPEGNHCEVRRFTSSLKPKAATSGPAVFRICDFKVCQTCRPLYRDRAWSSINTVLNSSCRPPPLYELENRRISDVNVVKKMGQLKWGLRHYALHNWEIESNKSERNSRMEFQDTVRQILRNCQMFSLDDKQNVIATTPESRPYDYAEKHAAQSLNLVGFGLTSSDVSRMSTLSAPNPLTKTTSSLMKSLGLHQGIDLLRTVQLPTSLSMNALDKIWETHTKPELSDKHVPED